MALQPALVHIKWCNEKTDTLRSIGCDFLRNLSMLLTLCIKEQKWMMFIFHRHLQTFYYLSEEWEHSCFRASSKIYSLSGALWCWYWQFYVENIQTEYYHHFGIFNFSTLNFVLDENPIFCGCQFDGPNVKIWQNYGFNISRVLDTLVLRFYCFNW